MKKIQPALNVLANVIVEWQEGFVVSADVFRSTVSRLGLVAHLSELWHIGKPDQDLGRLLFDYSNLTGATPINTPQSRLQLIDTFGELKMPTLVRLYVVAEELAVVYPNKVMHVRKGDVRRAFQRMIWTPENSLVMALLLSDDLVLVPTSLGFGSTVGPYGYGPITRFFAFMHEQLVTSLRIQNPVTNELITSIGIIYCDER